MALNDDNLAHIKKALLNKGATRPCEVCGNPNFQIAPEIAQVPVARSPGVISGQSIPSAVSACAKCGSLRFHALSILGLPELGSRNG